jgi:hypothetical protein
MVSARNSVWWFGPVEILRLRADKRRRHSAQDDDFLCVDPESLELWLELNPDP